MKKLTKAEATDFFAEVYRGKHHIPSEVRCTGADGKLTASPSESLAWCVIHYGELASYDSDALTRLTVAAHERRYRVAVRAAGPRNMRVTITRRDAEGRDRGCEMSEYHPAIEESVSVFRDGKSWVAHHHEQPKAVGA